MLHSLIMSMVFGKKERNVSETKSRPETVHEGGTGMKLNAGDTFDLYQIPKIIEFSRKQLEGYYNNVKKLNEMRKLYERWPEHQRLVDETIKKENQKIFTEETYIRYLEQKKREAEAKEAKDIALRARKAK